MSDVKERFLEWSIPTYLWFEVQKKAVCAWLLKVWLSLDAAADRRLGFFATPTIGAVLGGGIPAWIVSRAVILALVTGSVWYVVDSHNDKVRAKRDQMWIAKLERERTAAEDAKRARARETQEEIRRIEAERDHVVKSLASYTGELEKTLADTVGDLAREMDAKQACWSAKTVDVVRKKVRAINGNGGRRR